MDYAQTVDYLLTKLPMYSRIGAAAYRKDLTNTLRLSDYIGNPASRRDTTTRSATRSRNE